MQDFKKSKLRNKSKQYQPIQTAKLISQKNDPIVNVVMAIYNPDIQQLSQQLKSLNFQSYSNIFLIAADDCSTMVSYKEIEDLFKSNIFNFKYKLIKNKSNIGSNKTFEKLTILATGEYIAYCDQDDIWDSNKVSDSVIKLENENISLVYGDVKIIDSNGTITADSITEIYSRIKFNTDNPFNDLLYRNFVIGSTLAMKTSVAKSAVPFPNELVYDHWLALYASQHGGISQYADKLTLHRIHDNNQTLPLSGIKSKKDYYQKRILNYYNTLNIIAIKLENNKNIINALKWAKARLDYYNGNLLKFLDIIKYGKNNMQVSMFEIVLKIMPKPLFKMLLSKIHAGEI